MADTDAVDRLLAKHVALLAGGVPVALMTVRLLMISGGDTAAIAVMLRDFDLVVALVHTLSLLLPFALVFIGIWLVKSGRFRGWTRRDAPVTHQAAVGVWIVLTLYVVATVPWITAASMAAIALIETLFLFTPSRRARVAADARLGMDFTAFIILTGVLANSGPWWPAERLETEADGVRVGYVVAEGERLSVIWRAGGAEYLDPDEVTTRQPCSVGVAAPSLLHLGKHATRACPADEEPNDDAGAA